MNKLINSQNTNTGPFLVNPNLGHPIFLSIDQDLEIVEFQTHLLFVSQIDDLKKFEKSIRNKLKLVPIL